MSFTKRCGRVPRGLDRKVALADKSGMLLSAFKVNTNILEYPLLYPSTENFQKEIGVLVDYSSSLANYINAVVSFRKLSPPNLPQLPKKGVISGA